MFTIERLDAARAGSPTDLADLAALLKEAVDSGGSLGFRAPLPLENARSWWASRLAALGPDLAIWVAREPRGRIVGTLSLDRETRALGRHRGQVGKGMVLQSCRGHNLLARLEAQAEAWARTQGITLLMVGAQKGSASEKVHLRTGWTLLGHVPDYWVGPDGNLHDQAFMYKKLEA